ncbi:hypothetical protein BGZ99_007157, partial [Dissophora globulifera]
MMYLQPSISMPPIGLSFQALSSTNPIFEQQDRVFCGSLKTLFKLNYSDEVTSRLQKRGWDFSQNYYHIPQAYTCICIHLHPPPTYLIDMEAHVAAPL